MWEFLKDLDWNEIVCTTIGFVVTTLILDKIFKFTKNKDNKK